MWPALGYIVQVTRSLTPRERVRAGLMFVTIAALHVDWLWRLHPVRRPLALQGAGDRRRRARVLARAASRLRRRSHLGDRQHDPQADERRQATAQHRLLVLARSLDDRGRDRGRDRRRREGGLRRGLERQLEPRAVRRNLRHGRLGVLPVSDRAAQHRHPRGDLPRLPLDAPWQLRRGRARAPAPEPRADVPLLRQVDEVDHQGVADVPGRCRVRDGLRHRDRGRAAGHDSPARFPAPAVLRDPLPARCCSPPA